MTSASCSNLRRLNFEGLQKCAAFHSAFCETGEQLLHLTEQHCGFELQENHTFQNSSKRGHGMYKERTDSNRFQFQV